MRLIAAVLLCALFCQSTGAAAVASQSDSATSASGFISMLLSFVTALNAPGIAPPGTGKNAPLIWPAFDRAKWLNHPAHPDRKHHRAARIRKRNEGRRLEVRYPHAPPDLRKHPKDERIAREYNQIVHREEIKGRTGRPGRHLKAQMIGTGDGAGINPDAGAGINHWWAYEERAIPGLGKAMVNVGTGNVIIQATDVDIPQPGIDLAFQRTWNSQSLHDVNGDDGAGPSIEGNGWTSTFDAHLVFQGDALNNPVVSVYDIDGTRYDYNWSPATSSWTPPAGHFRGLRASKTTRTTAISGGKR
ncbi:MAG: hypothetical protein JO199_14640, partial [Candidatus Eremiobacteraeota bacterium]|nr:hypothetical protein [Candidatus Eremiobacteraeota bacterium]